MADQAFFAKPVPVSVREIAALTGAVLSDGADQDRLIDGVSTLDQAGPSDICFAEKMRYLSQAGATRAGACFCRPRHVDSIPAGTIALATTNPHRAFALVLAQLYPGALRPGPVVGVAGIAPGATVDRTAVIEDGAIIEPGAVIGPRAEIGRGTVIGPLVVIGPGVRIGRNCSIGAHSTLQHAYVGDNVIIHPGVCVGQDGFGFIPGAEHLKVPQVGRVLIQDNVEIGANTTIDRGAIRDTVIGEGSKIDNQVQIGHNVVIGRRCIIAGQVGVAGSATIGDYVVIGGQTGINGHITIGDGAQIAGVSAVHRDVPAGSRWAGAPARPVQEWLRARSREMRESGVARPAGDAAESDKEGLQ